MLLLFLVSPLPHQQNISLWGLFFISGNNFKKATRGEIGWIGKMRHGGHAVFGQKLPNTQCGVGRHAHKSPTVKCAKMCWKCLQKNWLKPNTASHNTTTWCTDTDGFLEHSPSGANVYNKGSALQKIILFFFFLGPPCKLIFNWVAVCSNDCRRGVIRTFLVGYNLDFRDF